MTTRRVGMTLLTYDQTGQADISCLVAGYAINHGRTDTESQPEPSTLTADLVPDPGDTTAVVNLITDPRTTGSAPWTGVSYSAGVATITAASATSPNMAAAVGTKVGAVVQLRNPTATPISGSLDLRGTVGGSLVGGSNGWPAETVGVLPGQTVTIGSRALRETLAGADNGFRVVATDLAGLVVEQVLAYVGDPGVPYFDGTTPGAVWLGTPDASRSSIVSGAMPWWADIGSMVLAEVRAFSDAGAELTVDPLRRFVGRVTDLEWSWEEAGEHTPDRVVGRLTAVAELGDVGRAVVGDAPWPAELDGARVMRILALTPQSYLTYPAFSDPGTVTVLARDVDRQPALDLAREVADSGDGVLWQDVLGFLRYADARHRRNAVPALTLDACDVIAAPTWRRSLDGLLNRLTVGYGAASPQAQLTVADTASIGTYGLYEEQRPTQLATAAAAQSYAQTAVIRQSRPAWLMAELPLDLGDLTDAELVAALALDMHSLIRLTGLPSAGQAPTSAYLWVEGWRETVSALRGSTPQRVIYDQQLTLAVSAYCRTAPPPWWDDIDPAATWDSPGNVSTATWDAAYCLGPQPLLGRWNDAPANLQWNGFWPSLPEDTTWDTYTQPGG